MAIEPRYKIVFWSRKRKRRGRERRRVGGGGGRVVRTC